MAVNMSAVLVNAGLESLLRFVGDLNFELSEIPSSLIAGSIVGACSFFGGLVGGRLGLLIGGGIGYQINNVLLPTIRNVGQMLRELGTNQLRDLFDLLIRGIQNTVSAIQGRTENLNLLDLLERFGSNSDVQMNIINILVSFFSIVHGSNYRQITP